MRGARSSPAGSRTLVSLQAPPCLPVSVSPQALNSGSLHNALGDRSWAIQRRRTHHLLAQPRPREVDRKGGPASVAPRGVLVLRQLLHPALRLWIKRLNIEAQ